jgi:hypothetical protein
MTRKQFLYLTFPVLPYCAFKEEYYPSKGFSNEFTESIHQKAPNGNHLNFYFDTEPLYDYENGRVNVSFCNAKETDPFKKLKNVYNDETITKEMIQELYCTYLID